MTLITRWCNTYVYIWNARVSDFATLCLKFVLKALLDESCICRIYSFERLIDSDCEECFVFIILVI
jgi:hypothetical protein